MHGLSYTYYLSRHSYSAFGARGTAAASSDRSLLVTTTARPYGVTRQIAEASRNHHSVVDLRRFWKACSTEA
jgi:hypothetical protein